MSDLVAHLIVVEPGARDARRIPLAGERLVIGRGDGADVALEDAEVAERHLEIQLSANPADGQRDGAGGTARGHVLVRGDGPVWVNGRRAQKVTLGAGDLITLGRSALSYRYGAAETSAGSGAREVLERLSALARAVASGLSPRDLTERALADLHDLTGADRVMLARLTAEGDPLEQARVTSRGAFDIAERALSRTAMAGVLERRQPLLWSDTTSDPDLAIAHSVREAHVRSLICAPIAGHDGGVAGVLYVSAVDRPQAFGREALDVVTLYAQQLVALMTAAEREAELAGRARAAEAELAELRGARIVGSSKAIGAAIARLSKVASSDIAVLMIGETGTGKDLFARELHRLGRRARGPFVAVNCGALPGELLEAELFGVARGAYTGASADREGLIRAAHGGTLFLDEIGEMPLAQQAKLLRVLESRRVTPVGGDSAREVDFRIVAATNRPLERMLGSHTLREDLYYRLAGVTIELPPLRERGDDVIELAAHCLAVERTRMFGDQADSAAAQQLHLTPAALSAIRRHHWPGNVRELAAAVRRGALLSRGAITPEHLGLAEMAAPSPDAELRGINDDKIEPLAAARDAFLKRYVERVVDKFDGNRSAAAKALMVSRRTVFKYLDEV
ncbi:MAG: sigma 54-interacting transcriptional regulator [Myxococcales bacterium]|nr:sigma 54-interacting transcriptional regulator [Myxococcales bacterium]